VKKTPKIELVAECIGGHRWTMTDAQVAEARDFGCAMCPKCGNPATIEKVSASQLKEPRNG
jgi:hypothetical protein